jgi:hypothetical protein
MNTKLFLGGGFPLHINYINKIFIESGKFYPIYTDDKNLHKIIPDSRLLFHSIYWHIIKLLAYVFIFPIFFILFLFLILFSNRLNKSKSFTITQLLHSFWDTSIVTMQDGEIRPNIKIQFNAIRNVFNHLLVTVYLFFLSINTVLLGHSVYGSRVIMAISRKFNKKVYTFANWNYQLQRKNQDVGWWNFDPAMLERISSLESEIYFNERIIGKGLYEDSNSIFTSKKNTISVENLPVNIIFLHIFKDSAYNVIDKSKIFKDYFDWIINTLIILEGSTENWSLRLHPSADRWGENQVITLNNILKFVKEKYNLSLKNILIEEPFSRTNVEILRTAKKVVTFNGTIHLESLCFGIKPIVISDVMVSKVYPNLVLKPSSLDEYKYMINSNSSIALDKNEILLAKKILFIRENYIPLNSILNSFYTYRGDNAEKFNKALQHLKLRTHEESQILECIFDDFFKSQKLNTNCLVN